MEKYTVNFWLSHETGGSSEMMLVVNAESPADAVAKVRKKYRRDNPHDFRVFTPDNEDDAYFETPKCEVCGTTLTDGGDCPQCKYGEEINRPSFFNAMDEDMDVPTTEDRLTPDEFFSLVCSGSPEEVRRVLMYDRHPTSTYNRFGSNHSYIMGAVRNQRWDVVKVLIDFYGIPGLQLAEREEVELLDILLKTVGGR